MDFSINSKFYHYMCKIADMMILSVLWIITSLPLFTVGTSCTALYYCTVKVIRQENGSVCKDYLRAFRINFRQSLLVSLIAVLLCVLATMAGSGIYAVAGSGEVLTGIYFAYLVLLGFGLAWLHYVIAYIARFQASLGTILKNSLVICLTNLPMSLSMVVLFLIIVGGWLLMLPSSAMVVLILPAAYALVSSFLLERIFKKYLPENNTPPAE